MTWGNTMKAGHEPDCNRRQQQFPSRRHPHRLSDEAYRADPGPALITVCVKDDLPLLDGEIAETAVRLLLRRAASAEVTIHAYCVMSTHVHVVVTADGKSLLPTFVRSFKSGASHAINRLGVLTRKFRWQRSYYDTHAGNGQEARNQVCYVLHNPVEAGLCDRWDDWPHSAHLSTPL
ncbi:MAG: transposase [Armatimonadota bacterium]